LPKKYRLTVAEGRLFVIDRHALNGAELILLDFKAVFPTNSAIAYVQEALTFPHPSIEEK